MAEPATEVASPARIPRLEASRLARGLSRRAGTVRKRVGHPLNAAVHWTGLLPSTERGARVTAVMVGRNDDYMADFAQRLQATIAWNLRQVVVEVVFVEWNPPADRPLLSPDLTSRFQQVRAYVVAAEIHVSLCRNPNLALLEYHAKNVGIRRASSPWVLATNADVLLGLDTICRVRKNDLRDSVAYTAERFDIGWPVGRSKPVDPLDFLFYRRAIPHHPYGTGDFLLANRSAWCQARGYDESLLKHRYGCDRRGVAQLLHYGSTVEKAGGILHMAHPTSCTEVFGPHQGVWADLDNVPYHNPDDWGLSGCREIELAERVWQLG